MQYRKLGNTGTVVTAWCLGTMTFGNEASEDAAFEIADAYFAAGGNFIDTANAYSAGKAEEIVGRWLKARPTEAKQAVVATKGRFPTAQGPNDLGLSRRHLRRALDDSLRRLGVEQIDLYQMHAWDPLTPIEETLQFLDDAVHAGKIAYYGFSNYLGWQLTKAVLTAKMNGLAPPVTLQPQYNLLARDIEHEIVPAALDLGIGLLPWSPIGGGWLTGKYKRDVMPTGTNRVADNPTRGSETYATKNANDHTWKVLAAVEDAAKATGFSMAQVALCWVVQRAAVTSVILGARTREQLVSNLSADTLTLPPEVLAKLNEATAPTPPAYPYGANSKQRQRRIEGGR